MIYLDYAATTPLDPQVLEAMLPYLKMEYGNPGSLHSKGRTALNAVDKARGQVAKFFNCDPEHIIFTSGGSEGNNMVFNGIEAELRRRHKTHVVVSSIEHDSTLRAAKHLCMKDGFYLQLCPPESDGEVKLSTIKELVKDNTGLVSVMTANNETGVLNDVESIGKFCRENDILFMTDAVQAAGIVKLDTEYDFSYADFITVSSHKINGPKGVGAIYVRDKSLVEPLIWGGAEQEHGLRGGTENVAGIVGFGKACEMLTRRISDYRSYIEIMMSILRYSIDKYASQNGVEFYYNGENPIKTLNVCFPGIDSQTLLLMLDNEGVCVSAGSACTSHENTPSHVLTAMGIGAEDARSSIRISLSHLTKPEEIKTAAKKIFDCIAVMKGVGEEVY